jgi:hypothetical protein
MMVLSYILPITSGTTFPYLKIGFISNRRYIAIIGQVIPKAHRVLKRKNVNGKIISSLNQIYLSALIFKDAS